MATAVDDGLFTDYGRTPGSVRYGAEDAGPPLLYEHGRFVEFAPADPEKFTYGDYDGVYVKHGTGAAGTAVPGQVIYAG